MGQTKRSRNPTALASYLLASSLSVLLLPVATSAAILTAQWEVHITDEYDHETKIWTSGLNRYVGKATVSFSDSPIVPTDFGPTTLTEIGGRYGTAITSPITPLVSPPPFPHGPGSGLGSGETFSFFGVQDFPEWFAEQVANVSRDYAEYADDTGRRLGWAHTFSLRAINYGPTRGGTGTADYVASFNDVVDLYVDFASSGSRAYFGEDFRVLDRVQGIYVDGYMWEGYAVLSSLSVDGVSLIPEPTTLTLFGLGLAGLAATRRRKQ